MRRATGQKWILVSVFLTLRITTILPFCRLNQFLSEFGENWRILYVIC